MISAAVKLVFLVGGLCMWIFFVSLIMVKEGIERILEKVQNERELKLLEKKNPTFITQYLKFKTELNNWKDTKKEYKL